MDNADPFPLAAATLVTFLHADTFFCFNAADLFNPEKEGRAARAPEIGRAMLGAEAEALRSEVDLTAKELTQEREDAATEEAMVEASQSGHTEGISRQFSGSWKLEVHCAAALLA